MKNIKKILSLLIIALLIFTPSSIYAEPENTESPIQPSETGDPIASPSPTPTEKPALPEEKTIKFNRNEIQLDIGKSETLQVAVTPNNAEIEWSSSNEKIVTIENGKATAGTTVGEAVITATIKGTDIKDTCTVKVLEVLEKDAPLKKLVISNGTLDKNFDPEIFEYSVTIESNISKLVFKYELSDDKNVRFFGPDNNKNLKNGDKLTFKVLSSDGTNRIYTLTIIKDATSLELKSLKINGYALNEVFKSTLLQYTASIPYEVDTITVVAPASDNAATVNINGLTNLKVGNNTVTITVSDKNGNSKKYVITVTRESKTSLEEKPTSIINSGNNYGLSDVKSTLISKSVSDDDSFLKYVIVSLACLILFMISGIGLYFYFKTSPKKLKKELMTSKGKEEVTSPIIEVTEIQSQEPFNINDVEDSIETTKEYNIKKEERIPTLDELLNDKEDV